MVYTILDVALQLNWRYSQNLKKIQEGTTILKKGERGKIFQAILKDLFERYREKFCYPDNLSGFKNFESDVVCAQKKLKKDKKKKELKSPDRPLSFPLKPTKKKRTQYSRRPSEGAGRSFTEWQVENLLYGSDSY